MLMMCNTDPSDPAGEHWIAVYEDDYRHHGENFDSFARALVLVHFGDIVVFVEV